MRRSNKKVRYSKSWKYRYTQIRLMRIKLIEVSRFRSDEFIEFNEFVNRLPVDKTLQVVFIVNDW